MKISPFVYLNAYKILTFGMLWSIGGLIFTLLEKGVIGDMQVYPSTGVPYEFVNNLVAIPLMTFLGGVFLISLDVLFIGRWLKNKSFIVNLVIKSIIFLVITLLTTVLAGFSATSFTLGKFPWEREVWESVSEFFLNFAFWSIIIYAGFLNILFLFIIEVSNSFGSRLFWRFFSGKYHKPKIERRAFMFLDLKGSTQLAESLGHEQYYKFINQFIEDVSREVIRTWGTIYQYVGDEIVMIWPWEKRQLSVDCYFRIKESIERNESEYLRAYGVAPRFRVGIHGGEVLIGEIGIYKKDILYIGDVLNATSRIEQLCKEKEVDILVSEKIISNSEIQNSSRYVVITMGETVLRGKSETVQLSSIELSQ